MTELSPRLNTPISTKELERRWTAIRSAMDEAGIDVLVTHNNSTDWGYVRYFADMSQGGYGTTLIFPRNEPMTVVTSGPFGGDRKIDPSGDGLTRGIGRMLSSPYFPGVHYTQNYDTELAIGALEPYAQGTIGLVGTNQMVYPVVDSLKRGLPKAKFVEATPLIDDIKIIKSAEEEQLIRRTARMQDAAMQVALDTIKPGMRDIEVVTAVEAFSQNEGSEYGLYLFGSSSPDDPAPGFANKHGQQRVIEQGDSIRILIENSGAGGFYTELGRVIVVGKAPKELVDEHEFLVGAQHFSADLMTPGTPCAEIFEKYNAFMVENGRPPERRIHSHGQGYDLVERPLIRADEPAIIAPGMNFACHPINGGTSITDNYFVTDHGVERIHSTPQVVFEV